MGKATVSIRHVTWRDGRPRFIPGTALRALGYRGRDLRKDDGSWFSLDEAMAWSTALDAELKAARVSPSPLRGGGRGGVARRSSPKLFTLANLFADWFDGPRFAGGVTTEGRRRRKPLGRATIKFYSQNARVLEAFDKNLWTAPLAALTAQILDGLYDRLDEAHGYAVARAVMATLRAALTFAVRKNRLPYNPAKGLGIGQTTPRVRAASVAEISAMIAAADRLCLPELGDMILLAVVTGQRQADRLALEGGHLDDAGRLFFRQRKTGAIVRLKPLSALVARLEAARVRRAGHVVQWPQAVINESRGRPFTASTYRPLFRLVRNAAAAELPSLADLTDQDLRDTAVTWLANAGATDVQLSAVTGHDEATAAAVRKHYLGRTDADQSDAAIDKLGVWLEKKGVKL